MVQAAAAATLPAILGAFSNQPRRISDRPAMPSVAAAMAAGKSQKESRALAKAAREDRLMYLLSQPELIGLLVTIAGIYASQNIPFSSNETANEGLQAIATMSSVLIGLGHAGVGDLTTLLAAAVAAGFSLSDLLGDAFGGIGQNGLDLGWFKYFSPFTFLIDQVI